MKIKKYYLLILLSISFSYRGFSQCDDFSSANFEHTTNFWDWRSNELGNYRSFIINDQNVVTELELPNPFFPQIYSAPNISDLFLNSATKDFEPVDGWELIYKSFGSSLNNWVENPGFVLYNRFNGTLRVFLWANTDLGVGSNDAVLINKWDGNSLKASGIYAFTESVSSALESFSTDSDVAAVNIYQNPDGGMWLRFDITVAYDPCTCSNTFEGGVASPNISIMETTASLISTGDINLQATTTVSADNTVNAGQSSQSSQKATIYRINDALKEGATRFDGYIKFWESTDNLVQVADAFVKEDQKLTDVKFSDWKIPQGLKVLPYVGQILAIVDLFSTGGQKTSSNSPSIVSQMTALKYSTSTTGTISFDNAINGFSYYTPGCPHESITDIDPTLKPVYDHVLGVFNVVRTPQLEYVQYGCAVNSNIDEVYRTQYCDLEASEYCLQEQIGIDMPQIWQFRLKDEPKFVINPASQLQLMDIEYSLDFQLDDPMGGTDGIGTDLNVVHNRGQGFQCQNVIYNRMAAYPFLGPCYLHEHDSNVGSDFPSRLREQGYELISWPKDSEAATTGTNDVGKMTFSTGYAPGSCWDNLSFMVAHHPINASSPYNYFGDAQYIFNQMKAKLKVKCIFRRTDAEATATTEDVILITSFKCDITESSLNLPFSSDPNSAHTYSCSSDKLCVTNNGGSNFQITSVYGEDYYISGLSDKNNPGNPVFSLGYSQFPYNDYISGLVVLNDQDRRSSRNITEIISAAITTGNSATASAEVTAANEIIIKGNSILDGNVTFSLKNPMGCSGEPMPVQMPHSEVLSSVCNQINIYDPRILRSHVPVTQSLVSDHDNSISVYPNPAREVVNISLNQSAELASVEVYDSPGSLVKSINRTELINSSNLNLDTTSFENGVYFIKMIYSNGQTTTKSFMVMH